MKITQNFFGISLVLCLKGSVCGSIKPVRKVNWAAINDFNNFQFQLLLLDPFIEYAVENCFF